MTGWDGVAFMLKMIFLTALYFAIFDQVVSVELYGLVQDGGDARAIDIMDKIMFVWNALPFIFIGTGILYNISYAYKYGSGGEIQRIY